MSGVLQVNAKVKSKPLPCPGVQAVKEALQQLPASVEALVYSIAELVDARKGEKLEVYLDERQHPRQSLLNPMLGDCQGSSVCFCIPGKAALAAFMNCNPHCDLLPGKEPKLSFQLRRGLIIPWHISRYSPAACLFAAILHLPIGHCQHVKP